MRKILSLVMMLCLVTTLSAQTLNIVVGNVTYAVPASEAGDMIYANGSTLTVLNKTFNLSDITKMYVDNSSVTDDAVTVTYNGTAASVVVAGNVMQYLSVNVNKANVSILQSDNLAQEINYTLTGMSTDGSFYMDGSYKATLTLSDLSLTSADSAAINIRDGKRIAIAVNGTNTLADAASGSQKACFMVNGHSEFTGSGSLSITGNKKHGFWGDEYVQLKKKFTGTITVVSAVKCGLSVNQYFEMNNGTVTISSAGDDGVHVDATDNAGDEQNGQVLIQGGTLNVNVTAEEAKGVKCDSLMTVSNDLGNNTTINITCTSDAYAAKGLKSGGDMNITGGTITISTAGKGVWDSDDSSASACAALKADGNMTISGGKLNLTATGSGGKGIKGDGTLNISGGNITVNTSGGLYYNNGSTENASYSGNADNLSSNYTSSPKGIKVDGDITISGDTISVNATGNNAEGIESKADLYIKGGAITINSYDDAINCSKNMTISGGTVTTCASNNDGLDANANIYITGGTVAAFGSRAPECGIDAAEGYNIYITGGTVLGVGGTSSTPTNTTGSQAYINTTGTVTASTTIALANGSTTLATFTVPSTYSSSSSSPFNRAPGGPGGGGDHGGGGNPGGGGNGTYIMISAPGMSSGSSYTLTSGSSSQSVTARN
jgi:hypothetical protein